MRGKNVLLLGLLIGLTAMAAMAQPIGNWPAPSTWTPAKGTMSASTMGDIGNLALPFVPVTPCRIVDTRVAVSDGFHQPAFADGETRTYNFPASTYCTGLPTGVGAYSINVNYRPLAQASYLTAFPAGTTMPVVATVVGYSTTTFTGNAAIVPATSGQISVYSQYAAHVVIDINGYYTAFLNNDEYLSVSGSNSSAVIFGFNTSTNGGATTGVRGLVPNGGAGASGVRGEYGGSAAGSGVEGISTVSPNAAGVRGIIGGSFPNSACCGTAGVRGEGAFNGIAGVSQDRATVGVLVDSSGAWLAEGQLGKIGSSATQAYGVVGLSSGTANDTAAVEGRMTGSSALVLSGISSTLQAGVRGEASDVGVHGISNGRGVMGQAFTTTAGPSGYGILGFGLGATTYGVYGQAGSSGTTNWAVYASGNMGASGTKPFIEPHPHQADTVIRYVALEGPEAGTYFRGKGRFVGRTAVIEVPESFRLVTDPEGLTIQVTPVGDFASVAVTYVGLDRIELKSTRDVEFYYIVNGVRHTFKDWQVMIQSGEFAPESADSVIPESLSPEQKRYLVQNGSYNADGTVNMETAHRLGWEKRWEQRPPVRLPN